MQNWGRLGPGEPVIAARAEDGSPCTLSPWAAVILYCWHTLAGFYWFLIWTACGTGGCLRLCKAQDPLCHPFLHRHSEQLKTSAISWTGRQKWFGSNGAMMGSSSGSLSFENPRSTWWKIFWVLTHGTRGRPVERRSLCIEHLTAFITGSPHQVRPEATQGLGGQQVPTTLCAVRAVPVALLDVTYQSRCKGWCLPSTGCLRYSCGKHAIPPVNEHGERGGLACDCSGWHSWSVIFETECPAWNLILPVVQTCDRGTWNGGRWSPDVAAPYPSVSFGGICPLHPLTCFSGCQSLPHQLLESGWWQVLAGG